MSICAYNPRIQVEVEKEEGEEETRTFVKVMRLEDPRRTGDADAVELDTAGVAEEVDVRREPAAVIPARSLLADVGNAE